MKNIIYLILLSVSTISYSQIVQNNFTPSVIPPSPTASSLMKFEEVPVGYYTGIPSISIPITSAKLKNGQTLDVKLEYHPASTNANQEASDCGLGWSLIAGGTISRTVKGYPDEMRAIFGDPSTDLTERVGIYQTSSSGSSIGPNRYYEYAELFENEEIDTDLDMVNEFLWDVNVKGRNDTEHDLYQYNFMGYTGRFFIKKENGNLVVVKLDKNPLKITNVYNPSTFVHDSFTIVDEYGNQYLFNVKETSTYSDFFSQVSYSYLSSWNLAQIKDANNIGQASFEYQAAPKNEGINLSTISLNIDRLGTLMTANAVYAGSTAYHNYNPLPPIQQNIAKIMTGARKLDNITVTGGYKIYFNFTQGRSDSQTLLANAAKLEDISVKTWNNVTIKKFHLAYGYTTNNVKSRMILNEVGLYDKTNTFISKYTLDYKQNNDNNISLGKDYWGYFNKEICAVQNREPDAGLSDIDILQQMRYPEGGSVLFDYESNTYSYEGNTAITNFSANPDNFEEVGYEAFGMNGDGGNDDVYQLEIPTDAEYIDIMPLIPVIPNEVYQHLYLYKGNNPQNINTRVRFLACELNCSDCKIRVPVEPNTYYALKTPYIGGATGGGISYLKTASSPPQFLYGGGNRIRQIRYFDSDSISGSPAKEVNYDYSFFSNLAKSSGSLIYPKPIYQYEKSKRECVYPVGSNLGAGTDFDVVYDVFTTTDNLAAIKTKGAEVGYKNVTVSETNNGYKRLIYTSPIDYPETVTTDNTTYPFFPTLNIDYKRGLLLEESIYKQNNLLHALRRTVNTYSFVADTIKTGIKVSGDSFNNVRKHKHYSNYQFAGLDTISSETTPSCFCCFGSPLAFTQSRFQQEVVGWAKLDSTVTTESFYDTNSSAWDNITTAQEYTYNPVNYKSAIEEKTDAYGQTLQTKYFYPCDAVMVSKPNVATLVSRNIIGVPLVTQTVRGSVELVEKETEYGSFTSSVSGHPLILPISIYTKKGIFSNPPVKEITFDYDVFGNMVQFAKENGTPTSFIWGYKSDFPVAKIENCVYASISSSVKNAIDSATYPTTTTRANAILALNAARTALPGAMVTTQTYDPVLGITSSTDVKGYTTYYEYDDFGRLKHVKDAYGNILSETIYNYRPQN
jgi:YD repeat-containing protein